MENVLKKRLVELVAVAGFLLSASLIIWLTDADYQICTVILDGKKISPIGIPFWPAGSGFPWDFLYRWAAVPAIVLGVTALVVLVSGLFASKLASCRKNVIFILLFLALGPGLVVNLMLKDQLGRARPREVVDFGGD